jgi:hypothetical protein
MKILFASIAASSFLSGQLALAQVDPLLAETKPPKSTPARKPAKSDGKAPAGARDVDDAADSRRIAGDEMSKSVSGFYDNPSWGKMLIQIDGDRFYGTYAFRLGAVMGTVDKKTGVVKVVWCESDNESQNPRPYRGIAEFVFEKGDASKVNLKGKWKEGSSASTAWKEDWNLTKVAGPAPAELTERIKKKGKVPPFCDKA